MSTTVGNGLTVDGTVKASQATQAGEAVVLGSDGKVPTSLQATDMALSLDTNTKILTVKVNGTSKTVDLSGLSGMKQVVKEYSSYSDFYPDINSGAIPIGAEFVLYIRDTTGKYYFAVRGVFIGLSTNNPCYGQGTTYAGFTIGYLKFNQSDMSSHRGTYGSSGTGVSIIFDVLYKGIVTYWE